MARAAMDTITALHDPAQLTQLSGEGTSEKPCRLSILDPRPGIHAHPSFTHGHGDHKHADHKHPDDKHGDHQHPDGEHKDKAPSRTAKSRHGEPRVPARRRARDKEPA